MSIDGLILEYVVYVGLAIYYHITYGMILKNFLVGSIASTILLVGKVSIAMAVAEGLAAPA